MPTLRSSKSFQNTDSEWNNGNKDKENLDNHHHTMKESPSGSTTTTTTTTSTPLGLQRVVESNDPSSPSSSPSPSSLSSPPPVIPLHPHDTLGRNAKKKSMSVRHINLGLTRTNAMHVSRNACIVESISALHVTLVVPPETFDNRLVHKLQYRRRGDAPNAIIQTLQTTNRLVLYPGDCLIFYARPRSHIFQVVPMPMPAVAATMTTMTTGLPKVRRSKRSAATATATATATLMQQHESRKKICSSTKDSTGTGSSLLLPGECPYEFPWDIMMDSSSSSSSSSGAMKEPVEPALSPSALETQLVEEQYAWRAPSVVATVATANHQHHHQQQQQQHKNTSQDHDEDFEAELDLEMEEEEEEPNKALAAFIRTKDMHVTHANTFWKALHSDTPTVGIQLLHLLLTMNRLPTPKLCQELVQLVTIGCYFYSAKSGSGSCSHLDDARTGAAAKGTAGPEPMWDGPRLELATRYIEAVLQQHPSVAYDRLAEAAGSDYFQNLMDQLYTLPYTNKETSEPLVEESLRLHLCALSLFYRLLNGLIHRRGTDSPLIRELEGSNRGRSACKALSSAMAHIWVEWGHYIWQDEETNDDALLPIILDLTSLLGKIMKALLEKFIVVGTTKSSKTSRSRSRGGGGGGGGSGGGFQEAMDILWNALDQTIGRTTTTKKNNTKDHHKSWILELKLHWLQSLEWPELEVAVAKRLCISKEYQNLAAGSVSVSSKK